MYLIAIIYVVCNIAFVPIFASTMDQHNPATIADHTYSLHMYANADTD
jgi:hypothetical protein